MRIIGGKLRGTNLHILKNASTRPLKDMARESIFNLLIHSNKVSFNLEKSNILDLYSGTGSFGLECLSRQAKHVCFIENEKLAFKILNKNIEKLKVKVKTETFFGDVLNILKKYYFLPGQFDLIFCDPPFKDRNMEELIKLISKKNLLKKNGIIILHRNKDQIEKLPDHFATIDKRIYGVSKIIFGKLLS